MNTKGLWLVVLFFTILGYGLEIGRDGILTNSHNISISSNNLNDTAEQFFEPFTNDDLVLFQEDFEGDLSW